MDPKTLEQHLMTDPDRDNPDVAEAVASSQDCARVVEDSRRFEDELGQALKIPERPGLADKIIASRTADPVGPGRAWLLATAAAVCLGVGLVTFQLLPESNPDDRDMDAVWSHLAAHWAHDGVSVLAASETVRGGSDNVRALLDYLGISVDTGLADRFALGKICPTPDGRGAHLILDTEEGPITLIVMPRTQSPAAPASQTLSDGQEAWLVSLGHGSVAVIAHPNQGAHDIARQIRQQISIDDALRL